MNDKAGSRDRELDRLNRKLTMIGMFAAGIAHDYNNALTAVLGNISLAKFESEENSELMELLSDAEKASLRIKLMTERLSLYSRGIKLDKVKTDIPSVVRSVISDMMNGSACGHTFTAGESLPEADVDRLLKCRQSPVLIGRVFPKRMLTR